MWYILLLAIFVTYYNPVHCECQDGYYWREYTGVVPEDAIVAAQDINNNYLYVGQVLLENKGLIVVQIKEGDTSVKAFCNGDVFTSDSNIKILCGNETCVNWIRVAGENFKDALIENRPVLGGSQDGSNIYIGRTFYIKDVVVGKVNSWYSDNSDKVPLHIVDNNDYHIVYSYELLVQT